MAAAFIGRARSDDSVPDEVQAAVGYLGEAFVLEATRLGLATCWVAGSFDHARAATLVDLAPGEQVVAVTPLGYPTKSQANSERLLRTAIRASARLGVDRLAPGILDGEWPPWAVTAVHAVRLATEGSVPWLQTEERRPTGSGLKTGRSPSLGPA